VALVGTACSTGRTGSGENYAARMAYPEDALAPHEKLVLNLHPHVWVLVLPGAVLVLAIAAGVGAMVQDSAVFNYVAAIAILAAAVWFLQRFVTWISSLFVLTSDRVMSRRGVLQKHTIEIPLERINTVFAHQRLFERMLRIGDLEIESASEDGAQRFQDLRRPAEVQKEIYIQMEANENRKYDRIGSNIAGAQAAGAPSISDQISQLADLRDRGHITEAEYQTKKTELLGRM
jgi:uncharacterized membrane protein YdbT with pleckstrin-like domain